MLSRDVTALKTKFQVSGGIDRRIFVLIGVRGIFRRETRIFGEIFQISNSYMAVVA